jgi:hypothetical protein
VVRLDRTIQSKGKASTPKWHAIYIKRIRLSWYPGTVAQCRLEDAAPCDKVILPCDIDHIAPPLLMQLRPNGILR